MFIRIVLSIVCLPLLLLGSQIDVDNRVHELKEECHLPAIAVGIVRVGEEPLILTEGTCDCTNPSPINSQTLFPIGSITKSFTTHLVSQLAEENRLGWDDPVAGYLPDMRSNDTEWQSVTLRHLASHTTGLPREDNCWQGNHVSQSKVLEAIEQLPRLREVGSAFEYSNLMYLALGKVVERVTGKSYEQAVEKQILKPLGMKRTVMTPLLLDQLDNVAKGHRQTEDGLGPIPYQNTQPVAPAGAICSNIDDMVRWLSFQLGEKPAILTHESIQEMRAPHISTGSKQYGLGWFLTQHQGRDVVEHGGSVGGFRSLITFMPSEGIGMVLLTNCEDYEALVTLSGRLYDQLLVQSPRSSIFTEIPA